MHATQTAETKARLAPPSEPGLAYLTKSPGMDTSWRLLLAACALHLVLGVGLLMTNLPLCDEGFYGVPAHLLSTEGILRNPVMESAGIPYLAHIDRIQHWMAPLGMALQGATFAIFGFGLFTQRALSLCCGLGTLLAWYFALRRMIPAKIAALSCIFLSVDIAFCSASTRGRADMMSLFFATLALATYLNFRDTSFRWALVAANLACAISGLIHPNGGIVGFTLLAITIIYLDRSRVRAAELLLAAVPYVVLAGLWTAYIWTHEPSLWVAQFLGNVRGRVPAGTSWTRPFTGELYRVRSAFGIGMLRSHTGIRALLPVSYLVAILGCTIALRNRVPGMKWLLGLLAAAYLSLLLSEPTKQGWYLLHAIPVFTAILAVWVMHLFDQRTRLSSALAILHVFVFLLCLASAVYSISGRKYQRLYQPMITYLNNNVAPTDLVFGRSEVYFGLKCRTCLRDDERLGAYSGKHADFIVMDPDYREQILALAARETTAYAYTRQLLDGGGYLEVYSNSVYQVLKKVPLDSAGKPGH